MAEPQWTWAVLTVLGDRIAGEVGEWKAVVGWLRRRKAAAEKTHAKAPRNLAEGGMPGHGGDEAAAAHESRWHCRQRERSLQHRSRLNVHQVARRP